MRNKRIGYNLNVMRQSTCLVINPITIDDWGRAGLMVRASDSGLGDPGSILGRVGVFVSLSKRHLLPKSTGNTQE